MRSRQDRGGEARAWETVLVGLELLVDAECSLAALLLNLEEVLGDYSRVARRKRRRSKARH